MLTGKFHSHITLADGAQAEIARRLVAGKVTVIDLWRGTERRQDAMLTHHFVSGHRGFIDDQNKLSRLLDNVQYLARRGIKVVRTKLEFEYLDRLTPAGQTDEINRVAKYVEAHAEVGSNVRLPAHWAYSDNPMSAVQFLTTRVYRRSSTDMVGELAQRVQELPDSGVVELRVEAAIYDDNPAHDAWWTAT